MPSPSVLMEMTVRASPVASEPNCCAEMVPAAPAKSGFTYWNVIPSEWRGWEVVEVYSDAGISGTKGRKDRSGLDRMLNDASRAKFQVVMSWAIDRLGRSLIDLLGVIQHLEAVERQTEISG
jgi:Resolvase, N terminal domain